MQEYSYTRRQQRGVGLIEVLVAVLVFAVGIMGISAMQLAAKRSGYEATQRSIATSLARDIIERIRSNPGQLDAYVVTDLGSATVTFTTNCNTAACTPDALAARDLYEWNELLKGASEQVVIDGTTSNAGGLVDSRACITNDAGNVAVAIAWKGVNEMPNPAESDCGETSGLYGVDNKQRRLLVMTTYIGVP
jgi:type IV pilus assembly protein PilV